MSGLRQREVAAAPNNHAKSDTWHLAQGLKGERLPGPPAPQGVCAMAYQIIASQCTVCGACEFECPNAAIRLKGDVYIINPKKCTECEGHFDTPQCAAVCPVENTCVPAPAA
jgi:ferredoxin